MDFVDVIKSRDVSKIHEVFQEFILKNAKSFTFESMNSCTIQTEVWNTLIELLRDKSISTRCHSQCLQVLKILSRDQQYLDTIINESTISLLVEKADYVAKEPVHSQEEFEGISEAQKCIFNLVFSHVKSRELVSSTCVAKSILMRLSYSNNLTAIPHEVLLFDLKILFLISALCSDCRPVLRYSLQGVQQLNKYVEDCITEEFHSLSENSVQLCCESLKILFNLLLSDEKPSADWPCDPAQDKEIQCNLVNLVRKILTLESVKLLKQREELKCHAVNLLTGITPDCYDELIPQNTSSSGSTFNGFDVTSLSVLLEFLEDRLEKPVRVLQEELLPVLTVLIEFSRKNSTARKYLRSRVLPPLRDVMHRPEVGDTLRSKLCRLMTSPITQVEYLVAEFLFVLCKENVSRLIKYTGYGNAAGLLAHRGLMMGHPVNHVSAYSSDSEDSGTEEYKEVEHNINPITGSYEPERPNPLEQMSDEQKEFEAVKLVNMIDQLQRKGIIQPARIGEDGKPRAIEHVMELQKD